MYSHQSFFIFCLYFRWWNSNIVMIFIYYYNILCFSSPPKTLQKKKIILFVDNNQQRIIVRMKEKMENHDLFRFHWNFIEKTGRRKYPKTILSCVF